MEVFNLKMTVIIPVFNREKMVIKSIESVLYQTNPNFELLIIDDCSTDSTWEVINSFKDPRIRCYKLPINSGAAAARNFGIEKSTGRYISFLDSDDTFDKDFLKLSYKSIENTPDRVGFMWTGRKIITNGDISLQMWKPKGTNSYLIFLKQIRIGSGAGVTLKREVFDTCGNFNEELPAAEDTEFFFRISRCFDFTYTDEYLINIYKSGSNRLSTNYKRIAKAYTIFLRDHYVEIDKDPELQRIYYYKMMWLNFYIPNPAKAKFFLKKIPRRSLQDKIKIYFIYNMYKFWPLKVASYLHKKFGS